MSDAQRFIAFAEKEVDDFLVTLKIATELESPSYGDKAATDKCGKFFQKLYQDAGFTITVYPQMECGDHFVAEYGLGSETLMLVGHYDTVYPMGTLVDMPWKLVDGKAYGPGALDMKGGLVQIYYAMKILQAFSIPINKKILICVNSDEEPGSYSSRPLMEEIAKKSKYALVMESTRTKCGVKAARFGRAIYKITAHGKSSHSGGAPQAGISAILELAHQVGVLHAMNDFEKVLTVSPTFISAGVDDTATVPGNGKMTLDVRSSTIEALNAAMAAIENLQPKLEGMRLEIVGGMNKPVFEFHERNKALFAKADALATELGCPLIPQTVGGGSDGNFTSHVGTPTLDGLGVVGDFLHNPNEHVIVNDIPFRVALLARLIQDL